MQNPIYNLPEIVFVGGSKQELEFNPFRPDGYVFNLSGCTADFAVIEFFERDYNSPLINYVSGNDDNTTQKGIIISEADNNIKVYIPAEDPAQLDGQYIYQLTVKNADGEAEIPGHGILNVIRNINPKYVTDETDTEV